MIEGVIVGIGAFVVMVIIIGGLFYVMSKGEGGEP